jgi:5-carboxymethyl-2-hydroxymuconate isomerase
MKSMPHVILEASAPLTSHLKQHQVLRACHNVMLHSGLFNAADIKSRSYIAEDFLVGAAPHTGNFVHALIYLLEGRTPEQKQALTAAMHTALKEKISTETQISVDIRDLEKATYRK